jgi:hypothetical protein
MPRAIIEHCQRKALEALKPRASGHDAATAADLSREGI